MQYQVHLKSQTRENAQNLFSWIINEDDFSWKIRPCHFPTFIVLQHHTKFRQNPMTGNMKIMADGHTIIISFSGSGSTATCLKAQISTLVELQPGKVVRPSVRSSSGISRRRIFPKLGMVLEEDGCRKVTRPFFPGKIIFINYSWNWFLAIFSRLGPQMGSILHIMIAENVSQHLAMVRGHA